MDETTKKKQNEDYLVESEKETSTKCKRGGQMKKSTHGNPNDQKQNPSRKS